MSSSLSAFIQEVVINPGYSDYLAILKGARNGFVTGVKIRLPHALVMSVLFGRGECVFRIESVLRKLTLLQLADPRAGNPSRDQTTRHHPCQIRDDLQVVAAIVTQSARWKAE